MSKVLGERDANAPLAEHASGKDKDVKQVVAMDMEKEKEKDIKTMEYHRKQFQSRMAEEKAQNYVSPTDSILSPASAKISALRIKSAAKATRRSLFAQTSARKLNSENPFSAGPPLK